VSYFQSWETASSLRLTKYFSQWFCRFVRKFSKKLLFRCYPIIFRCVLSFSSFLILFLLLCALLQLTKNFGMSSRSETVALALLVTSRITRSDKVRCPPEPVSSSSCVVVVAVSSSAWSKSTYVQNEITISLFFEQKNEPDRQWRSSCFPFYNSLLSYQWWSVHLATTSSNFSATTKLPIIWRWPLTLILSTSWKRSDLEPYAMHDAVVSASLRLKSTTTD